MLANEKTLKEELIMSIQKRDSFRYEKLSFKDVEALGAATREFKKLLEDKETSKAKTEERINKALAIYGTVAIIAGAIVGFFSRKQKAGATVAGAILAAGNATSTLINNYIVFLSGTNHRLAVAQVQNGANGLNTLWNKMIQGGYTDVEVQIVYEEYYDTATNQEVASHVKAEPYIRAFWKNGVKYTLSS